MKGSDSWRLSKPKCMTASVYPHTTQLRLLAVSPSKTPFPTVSSVLVRSLIESSKAALSPKNSRPASRSRALASSFRRLERSWNSSCASWCSREENSRDLLDPSRAGAERASITGMGLIGVRRRRWVFKAARLEIF